MLFRSLSRPSWNFWIASFSGRSGSPIENTLRASARPYTGWAGFHYDAGLPRAKLKEVLIAAARNDIRCAGLTPDLLELYEEVDRVVPLAEKSVPAREYDLVGPICESSDFLAKSTMLPELSPGDLIGIADAGAYGFVMASRYNSHELPLEICVSEGLTVE